MTLFQYTPYLTYLYIFHVQYVHNLNLSYLNKLELLQLDNSPTLGIGFFPYTFSINLISELSHLPAEILIIQNCVSKDNNDGSCIRTSFNDFFNISIRK